MAALGAIILYGHIPGHKSALGALFAGIVGISFFGRALKYTSAALGAATGHLDDQRLCKGTFGETGAGKESAEASGFYDHILTAYITLFVGNLIGHLYSYAFQRLFCLTQRLGKALVELFKNALPFSAAFFHLIKSFLHLGSKGYVHDVFKALCHETGNGLAKGCGLEHLALLDHILSVQNGGHGGSIGTGTAYSLFFHSSYKGILRISCRRLGKLLFLDNILQAYLLTLAEAGKGTLLQVRLILTRIVNLGKALELDCGMGSAEHMSCGNSVYGNTVIDYICHLTCHESVPDKFIQSVLLGSQILTDFVGSKINIAGTDGFMSILSFLFALVNTGSGRAILVAVVFLNEVSGGSLRLLRYAQGVGSHISNKTHGTDALNIHAFVKSLRNGHGPAGSHIKFT